MMPDSPPTVKIATSPTEYIIAVVYLIDPPHIVASQLKIFTPVGMAMIIVLATKKASSLPKVPTMPMSAARSFR